MAVSFSLALVRRQQQPYVLEWCIQSSLLHVCTDWLRLVEYRLSLDLVPGISLLPGLAAADTTANTSKPFKINVEIPMTWGCAKVARHLQQQFW